MALAVMTIDPNAGVMTGEEIRDAIIALADNNRRILITRPTSGKHRVVAHNVDADGHLEIEFDDEAEA